ncbi:unnamed protein product [Pelagomonas calceolata]|uniref:MYND-type domain-containing protein n=1 Tax=Pelagomonas calceolata TaxID=35677 RepID=A0A8J2X1M1_9STRA|nr:unnamed protein product [Pelagomonas calceolata]
MILTNCAACAAPLAHNAPRCVRCWTRYCDATCQHDHWRRGHKQMCKKIHRGGNAEQYNADKKYKEAVAVAVAKCAEDTKGQTCYICTQALHWKTKEGLVRGCACRGTAGFAHVSCLAEQAKILLAEAEENNLDEKALQERWTRWHACSLCEQDYHGVVACALGWACWKTYVGRPEADQLRGCAMNQLGNGLSETDQHKDALSVRETELAMRRRLGSPEQQILALQNNLANSYEALGRDESAMSLRKGVYSAFLKLYGEEHRSTLLEADNYAMSLLNLERVEEAKSLLLQIMPVARRVLGDNDEITLKMRRNYAQTLYMDDSATLDDLREAVTTIEELERIARRVFGGAHPLVVGIEGELRNSRTVLRAREDGKEVQFVKH